jgi:hypothetical protein
MSRRPAEPRDWSQRFRPQGNLWPNAWRIWIAFSTPVFAALYLLTVPQNRWVPFLLAHVLLMVAFAAVAGRLHKAGVLLAKDGIREREYLGSLVFTPAKDVASVIVVKLRDPSSDRFSRQYFVVDHDGRTVLRLRGQLWHPTDLAQIVDFYGVPVRYLDEELSWRQLRREYGRNLDRWERHPVLTTVLVIALFFAMAVPILLATMAGVE